MPIVDVPIAGERATLEWAVDVSNGINDMVLGRAIAAYPFGYSAVDASSATTAFIVVTASLGGALLQPVVVPSEMYLQSLTIRQGATSGAKTAEFALYYDTGSTTLTRVTGTDGTFSFTPSAADDRTANISVPGTLIRPGTYFVAIRNTSASQTFSIRRAVPVEMVNTHSATNNTTGAAALGSTLDYSATGWSAQVGIYYVRLNGRAMGQSAAF
jgi:hypothetical protein